MDAQRLAGLIAECDVPGASLAVSSPSLSYEIAAGVLNRRTGEPARPDSLWQIGSITKVWTATQLVRLADEGVVDLDTPVSELVPEAGQGDLPIARLLDHTSGLPGDWFPDTGRGEDCLERFAPLLAGLTLEHEPGRLCSYSNAAYSLAGRVIERLTGTTWDRALREQIVDPLGLTRTVTLPEEALLHGVAVGHLGGEVTPTWGIARCSGPAGAINAAASDVVTFARSHLSRPSRMTEQRTRLPLSHQGIQGFGLGWSLARWGEETIWLHDGGTIGQCAALRVIPEADAVIVLLTNGGRWADVRDGVIGEVARELGRTNPPRLAPDPAAPPAPTDADGSYRSNGMAFEITGAVITAAALDPIEALAGGGPSEHRLVPHAVDVVMADVGGGRFDPVSFVRDGSGRITHLHTSSRAAHKVA